MWDYWINEPVFLDEGVLNILKRKHAIYVFCTEGLLPFLERFGFAIVYDEKQLTAILLRMLYALSQRKQIKSVPFQDKPYEEVYAYYLHLIDSQEWERFWSTWGQMQDFLPDSFGYKLRAELPEFIWSWLDFDSSYAIQDLLRELEEADSSDEGTKGKDDPYLQETLKRDYQDRHW